MQIEFIQPFLAATMKVLKTMANTEAKPGRPFKKNDQVANGIISAVIELTGGTKGSVGLTFTEACIVGVVNNMLGESYTAMNDDIADAVGELVNMISGEARRELAEKGFVFHGGIPKLLQGAYHLVQHTVSGVVAVIPFKTDTGIFSVEACFESENYFEETQKAQKTAAVQESNKSVVAIELKSFLSKESPAFKSYILKPNSQVTKPNFFLVPEYTEPTVGNDFCNFTALEVSVCPETFFASSFLSDFKHAKNPNHAWLENTTLQQAILPQLRKIKEQGVTLPANLYSVGRTVENAILAYNLAIRSSELLVQYHQQFWNEHGKIGEYALKAALLSKLQRSDDREKEFLEIAFNSYKRTLGMVTGEQFFRRCFRVVAISIYREDYTSAKEATAVMIKYFQANSANIKPEEAPRIRRYLQLVEKISKEKEQFSISKHRDRTDYLFLE